MGFLISELLIRYADDLVIFCSSGEGFQQMLKICSECGVDFDIKFNSKKSNAMIVKVKDDQMVSFHHFYLSGEVLNVCSVAKYLGHFYTDDLN